MTDGSRYVPYDERTGAESVVYFTRDLSAAGIMKVFEKVNQNITGKVAIKLHTGEPKGPNITPPSWVKEVPTLSIRATGTPRKITERPWLSTAGISQM